jgi:hypothetical protein
MMLAIDDKFFLADMESVCMTGDEFMQFTKLSEKILDSAMSLIDQDCRQR